MDRFEADYDYIHSTPCKHLHSSMDRFEGFINVVVIQHIAIYIPVWIDLKRIDDTHISNYILFTFQYG